MYSQNFEEYQLLYTAANKALASDASIPQAAGLDANAASVVSRVAVNLTSPDANAKKAAMAELRSALDINQRKALYKAALEKVPFTFR
jgi:hypothetical protein